VLECWVVDLEAARIFTFADPGPDGYRLASERRGDDVLTIASLPHLSLTVSQLLGDVAI